MKKFILLLVVCLSVNIYAERQSTGRKYAYPKVLNLNSELDSIYYSINRLRNNVDSLLWVSKLRDADNDTLIQVEETSDDDIIRFDTSGTQKMTILANGNVGVGVAAPVNKLDIEGSVAIGAGYSGTYTAPANGLIVQGCVGIGTTSPISTLQVNGTISDATGYVAPVGSIVMYGAASAPTGWLVCNGAAVSTTTYSGLFAVIGYTFGGSTSTFNLPDMRGVFAKGAGTTSRTLGKDAAGNYYAAVLGTYDTDSFQEHAHDYFKPQGYNATVSGFANTGAYTEITATSGGTVEVSSYGVPRLSTITEPQSLGLNYIIKY